VGLAGLGLRAVAVKLVTVAWDAAGHMNNIKNTKAIRAFSKAGNHAMPTERKFLYMVFIRSHPL
jgi:hypothetical protein